VLADFVCGDYALVGGWGSAPAAKKRNRRRGCAPADLEN
jgi:hypothetical protein